MDEGDQQGVSSGGGMVNSTLYNSSNCWVVVSCLNHNEWIMYTSHQSLMNCCRSLNWLVMEYRLTYMKEVNSWMKLPCLLRCQQMEGGEGKGEVERSWWVICAMCALWVRTRRSQWWSSILLTCLDTWISMVLGTANRSRFSNWRGDEVHIGAFSAYLWAPWPTYSPVSSCIRA